MALFSRRVSNTDGRRVVVAGEAPNTSTENIADVAGLVRSREPVHFSRVNRREKWAAEVIGPR
jgi:hypothetical protein